jgi:DNA-binding response OmpR family regulator
MRILIIEDNKDLCDAINYRLQKEDYNTDVCYSGEYAMDYALNPSYDLIILDRMLPVMDGLSILKAIRKKGLSVPVIMVTARDGLHDRIDGLDSGADDYLVKPFAMEELLARIRALYRRPQQLLPTKLLTFSNLELDIKKQSIRTPEKASSLSKRETDLFEYFLRHPNQILPRGLILTHIWGPDYFVEDGNLDNYIHFLRRRLSSIDSDAQIKTVHGVGYQLISRQEVL